MLLGACALALLAWEGWLFRGRQPLTAREKVLVLVGLALLPALTLFFSQAVAYEHMKTVAFCSSCHVMDPYVASLADPKARGLAAAHVQNHRMDPQTACATCHSNYGLLGPVRTKLRGLKHLMRYYTRSPGEPVKLYDPFPNANCLRCHAGARSFEAREEHVAVRDQLTDEGMSCLGCHTEAHHLEFGGKP